MSENQLALPYEEITKKDIAGRDAIRANFTLGTKTSYWIKFSQIQEREGFNKRIFYEGIEELAESLLVKQETPFELDILKDGRALLKEGHRRKRAYEYLIKEGKFDPETMVEFFPTKNDVTERDRMVQQYRGNNLQEKFKPIANANIAYAVKFDYGEELSNEQVAKLMGISRQSVDNFIRIAKQPDDVKNTIKERNLSIADAIALINSLKPAKIQADKAEENAAQTSMYVQPFPEDSLREEMKELEQTEEQAEIWRQKEERRQQKEDERLQRDANKVQVTQEALTEHLGKRLAADAYRMWDDDLVDEKSGEVVSVPRKEYVMKQGKLIEEATIQELIDLKVENIYVYKEVLAAPSVITELPAEKEKGKYDEGRVEIAQIQNAIKLSDRIGVRVEKLEISEGDKKDLTDWVKWLQNDLVEAREYIHKHKQENKRDR